MNKEELNVRVKTLERNFNTAVEVLQKITPDFEKETGVMMTERYYNNYMRLLEMQAKIVELKIQLAALEH